jgi:hypothetical protein
MYSNIFWNKIPSNFYAVTTNSLKLLILCINIIEINSGSGWD